MPEEKPSDVERQQRITLKIDGIGLRMIVPASQESSFRKAGQELALTTDIYRRRYPAQGGMPPFAHVLMASIDIAYRNQLWKQEADTRSLADKLNALSQQAEEVWLQHQSICREIESSAYDEQ